MIDEYRIIDSLRSIDIAKLCRLMCFRASKTNRRQEEGKDKRQRCIFTHYHSGFEYLLSRW